LNPQSKQISIRELTETARNIRKNIIEMISTAGSGHPGGSLSAVEILTTLYFKVMNHDPQNCVMGRPGQIHFKQGARRTGTVCHFESVRLFT
jgi:transketolase N-terminal domain/subunit